LYRGKLIIALAVLMSALMLGGCASALLGAQKTSDTASAGATSSADPSTVVVAEVNGEKIYKDAYDEMYAGLKNSNTYSTEDEAIQAALDALIKQKVFEQKMEELGYSPLSDAEIAQVQAEMDASFEEIIESDMDYITSNLGDNYTDEDLEAAEDDYIDSLLSYYGYTRDTYLDQMVQSALYKKATENLLGDTAPTEEEIVAKYNEYVAADQTAIEADPASYIDTVSGGTAVYYVPSGVRMVRQVLILMDEETRSAISLLRSNSYDASADILQAQGLAAIEEKASEVLSGLQSGSYTFDEAIARYNEDTGMPEEGYPVMSGTDAYAASFTDAAMALTEIGSYTELVPSDFGYHIIEYVSDVAEGPVAYDSVRDAISEELKSALLTDGLNELIDQWKAEANIVTYKENL
jgi:parvulin-like peptidyl-prolyl isomerase